MLLLALLSHKLAAHIGDFALQRQFFWAVVFASKQAHTAKNAIIITHKLVKILHASVVVRVLQVASCAQKPCRADEIWAH